MSGHVKFGSEKDRKRSKRKFAIRKRITGTAERPRLSVFRSAKHVYVQAIDDITGHVLAAASDLEPGIKTSLNGAKKAGRAAGACKTTPWRKTERAWTSTPSAARRAKAPDASSRWSSTLIGAWTSRTGITACASASCRSL